MPIRPENRVRYPADWHLRRRFILDHRARGRCEWCGAANGEPNPRTGSTVVLTLAHVHDKRPESAGLLNLAALCQACHLGHDNPTRQRDRKARLDRINGQRALAGLQLLPTIRPPRRHRRQRKGVSR